jgi:hypothetical protein
MPDIRPARLASGMRHARIAPDVRFPFVVRNLREWFFAYRSFSHVAVHPLATAMRDTPPRPRKKVFAVFLTTGESWLILNVAEALDPPFRPPRERHHDYSVCGCLLHRSANIGSFAGDSCAVSLRVGTLWS